MQGLCIGFSYCGGVYGLDTDYARTTVKYPFPQESRSLPWSYRSQIYHKVPPAPVGYSPAWLEKGPHLSCGVSGGGEARPLPAWDPKTGEGVGGLTGIGGVAPVGDVDDKVYSHLFTSASNADPTEKSAASHDGRATGSIA